MVKVTVVINLWKYKHVKDDDTHSVLWQGVTLDTSSSSFGPLSEIYFPDPCNIAVTIYKIIYVFILILEDKYWDLVWLCIGKWVLNIDVLLTTSNDKLANRHNIILLKMKGVKNIRDWSKGSCLRNWYRGLYI